MSLLDHFAQQIDDLKQHGNLRQFSSNIQQDRYIYINDHQMLNLSSNDYLGLASDKTLREEFFDLTAVEQRQMTSSSSRLLTGNFPQYEQLESSLSQAFQGRVALLFNSGYHMNIGILPAVCDKRTLVLADKLIHASIIDGIQLSSAKYIRYRHNDLDHLNQLLAQYHADENYDRIIVVTESIFSMDGDETDLAALVKLKQNYAKVMLYVDEAHAIGVRGDQGLGCAEQYNVIDDIDFLVGTFGKAMASIGGYLICHPILRDFLINKMRPLIFSTAQPPICMAWTDFIFHKMLEMYAQRQELNQLGQHLRSAIQTKQYQCPSSSHIVPVILGNSIITVTKAKQMQDAGFFVMPVRPPTVPNGSARLRICLNAKIKTTDLDQLAYLL